MIHRNLLRSRGSGDEGACGPAHAARGTSASASGVSRQRIIRSRPRNRPTRSSQVSNSRSMWWLGICTNAAESWESRASKRSRSRSVSADRRRSSMSALETRRGTPTTIRKTWRARTRSSAGIAVSGVQPDIALAIARRAVARRERLAPAGPKRTPAKTRSGIRKGSAV